MENEKSKFMEALDGILDFCACTVDTEVSIRMVPKNDMIEVEIRTIKSEELEL